ncbi:hypothetical protein GCK32_005165 [Trichostrongylus colubriformis]|uniref:Uncharacterized protein n=1 Tax=Trichostrongylus colubriformis TaxID=6319 RepID=A0AAN8J1Q7_TRICO
MTEEVEAEEKYYQEKIPLLEARNRQLEMMLVDQQELQKDLEQTENRLRACESQLDEARKTELKLKDELKGARESVNTLKKTKHDLKNKVAILEKELRDVRGTANIGSTPFNPKPRSLAVDQRGLKSNRPTGFCAVQSAAAKALTSLEDRNGSTNVISRQPGLKRRLNQNDLDDNQRLSLFPKKKSL